MIQVLKQVIVFITFGFVANGLTNYLESEFLNTFLNGNLVLVLIALLAINATTAGLILTRISDITQRRTEAEFSKTCIELKRSTGEQLALVVLAILFQVLKSSPSVVAGLPHALYIFESCLVGIFVFALYILWDTACAIYVIVGEKY